MHENLYEDSLVTVRTDGGGFQATLHHPVWVLAGRELAARPRCVELEEHEDEGLSLAGRWVNSHDLRPGDVLVGRDGGQRIVMRVEQEFVSSRRVVNLTIESDHTYAVGDGQLLVHNTQCPKPHAAEVEKVDAPKVKPVNNFTVHHSTRKKAKEAAAHAHGGKPRPTPPKTDKAKRKAYEEQQKYQQPESHPDSDHTDLHFHDGNKSILKDRHGINRHHTFPE